MNNKPRILVLFGYHRKGWIEPFLKISQQFDLHFLFFLSKEFDEVIDFDFPRYYWYDFKSIQQILDTIQPNKIVFLGLDSGLAIAMNIVARQRKIPTFLMQHGLYRDYEFYVKFANQNSSVAAVIPKNPVKSDNNTFKILLKSIRLSNIPEFVLLINFILQTKKKGVYVAMHENAFSGILPDKLLGFTLHNVRLHFQREGIKKENVIIIGNPYFDDILSYKKSNSQEKYYLLIDQPLVDNRFGFFYNTGISKEQVNIFYGKLNEFALKNDAKLYIKLHPGNYQSTFMLQHPNIVYIKDADTAALIGEAEGCFGCASTLMLPVLYKKPSILFSFDAAEDVENMGQFGLAKVYDYNSFSVDELIFIDKNAHPEKLKEYIDKFLFDPEHKAVDKLAQVLNS